MIACPELDQLAQAATTGSDELAGHTASCGACRALLEEQRSIRALALAMPAPARMSAERREALAAATLALADRDIVATPSTLDREARAAATLALAERDVVATPSTLDREARAASRLALAERDVVAPPASRLALADADRDARANLPPQREDAEAVPVRGRARWIVAGAAAAALIAVALAAALAPRDKLSGDVVARVEAPPLVAPPPPVAAVPDHEQRERVAVAVSPLEASEPKVARVDAAHAQIDRVREGGTEVIRLREGTVTVDTRGASPVAVTAADTRVGVGAAVASVAAKNGAIVTVTVVAGSVEVVDRGRTFVVAAGDMWERDASADQSFTAFREGWTMLRAGNDREAIAAFDRATHKDIAEDAAYWAAVAAERTGDKPGAVRRFDDFLTRFPRSPRVDGARAALDRLR